MLNNALYLLKIKNIDYKGYMVNGKCRFRVDKKALRRKLFLPLPKKVSNYTKKRRNVA